MSGADEHYRALLRQTIRGLAPSSPEAAYTVLRLEAALHAGGDEVEVLADLYVALHAPGLAGVVLYPTFRNLDTSLQRSIAHLLEAIPKNHTFSISHDVIARLFLHGELNVERRTADPRSELILIDPRLMLLYEAVSMALMSQLTIGEEPPTLERLAAARFVRESILAWYAHELPEAPVMPPRLTEQQMLFGSMMTRRAIDFVVAHELGHVIANAWPPDGRWALPVEETGEGWRFERQSLSPAWQRELFADSVASWILSHSVVTAELAGHDRRDHMMAVYAGAAMVLAIEVIREELFESSPVTELKDGSSSRLLWDDESYTHPAAFLRATEILPFLRGWMGACDEAESYARHILADLPRLWHQGALR